MPVLVAVHGNLRSRLLKNLVHLANPGCRLLQGLLWTCAPLAAIATSEVRRMEMQQPDSTCTCLFIACHLCTRSRASL